MVVKLKQIILFLQTKQLMWRLIGLYTLTLFVVILALLLPIQIRLQDEIKTEILSSSKNLINLANNSVDNYFTELDNNIFPVTENYDSIILSIQNESVDYTEQKNLTNYLKSFLTVRNDVYGVCLYIIDNSKCYIVTLDDPVISVKTYYDSTIPNNVWYKNLSDSPRNMFHQSLIQDRDTGYDINLRSDFLAYHRGIIHIPTRTNAAVLSLYLDTSEFEKILKNLSNDKDGRKFLMFDLNEHPFYSNDPDLLSLSETDEFHKLLMDSNATSADLLYQGQNYFHVRSSLNVNGYSLVMLIPETEATTLPQSMSSFVLFIALVLSILALVVIVAATNRLTRPIAQLAQHMNNFGSGALWEQAEEQGKDEVSSLAVHFNQMVRDTNRLIDETYRLKLAEKTATIKALEAETDPHYLYNSLQAIATLALKYNAPSVYQALLALSSTFRYTVSAGNILSVSVEIKNIENYISIQKLRFFEQLEIQYDIDNSLRNFPIPKLTLLLSVENAIKHADVPKDQPLIIQISVKEKNGFVELAVHDNGTPIAKDRLDQVTKYYHAESDGTENSSIGLQNLYTRLKLIYGDNAQMYLSSDHTGTTACVLIPLQSESGISITKEQNNV